ncbi:unnamed protein product [Lathyrus sativus]|nr:unnamed protein product [Lathyrus sativus]
MTNDVLLAVIDGCHQLESLDIRQCFNINFIGSLAKRCKENIKYLWLPNDATDDYPFETKFHDGAYEDYAFGISYDFSGWSECHEFLYDANYYDLQ